MKTKQHLKKLFCIGIVLTLAGSIFASLFNSGMGSVKVSRIRFDGGHGELSGLLYMPKDVSEDNPAPTIIVTHGYLNSCEMQDANAIELSRRGFVVLALDQYDHGHSNLSEENYSDASFFGVWLPFWLNSMNDAVQYMYEQPYVLKDSDGNGIIGIEGHSMGGFSTTMALAMDESQYAETGVRKVFAGLTEGSDFSYSSILNIDAATADALGGGRYMGKVAAQYDEFFFNAGEEEGTVRKKDFVSTSDGETFLELTEPGTPGTWYETADGGNRIVYEPSQTHPWNHFSKTTTADAISFFMTAFADYSSQLKDVSADSQIWQWKEACECIALIGFVILLIAFGELFTEIPVFSAAATGELAVSPAEKGSSRAASVIVLIIASLLPSIFFYGLVNGQPGTGSVLVLFWLAIASAAAGVIALFRNKEKNTRIGAGCAVLFSCLLAVVCRTTMYSNNQFWTAVGLNSIVYWTVASGLICAVVLSLVYTFMLAKQGYTWKDYGIVWKPKTILAGLCAGLLAVIAGYAVLFLVDAVFKTDFRIWTFAFKTFDASYLPAMIRYIPSFLLYYLMSTISITVNTNKENLQGWKGYVTAVLMNAGGPALWVAIQYGTLFATGTAFYPDAALSGIMIIAMVPTLAVAAVISRALYKKTGNVWTAAFLNGILITVMSVANTFVVFR